MRTLLSDPSIPAPSHSVWCRNHDDGGPWDQRCSTAPLVLHPLAAKKREPMVVSVQLDQFSRRGDDDPGWTPDEVPEIELTIRYVTDFETGETDVASSVLAIGEARQVAAALLNLCDLADTETGRSDL